MTQRLMRENFGTFDLREETLLGHSSSLNDLAKEVGTPGSSVLLDMSTFPKRVFMFLVKQLLAQRTVKDLVVSYTRAAGYREGALTEDAEPPAALPGYARVSGNKDQTTLILSVGYMAFNLAELLEQAKSRSLKFLFPFPPGSPTFRRNWRLLQELAPKLPIETEIRRIHAMDMFAALDWLGGVIQQSSGPIDMVPLGPKPHALAMAMAHRRARDLGEILYSQPRAYNPEYSFGIANTPDGAPDILGYCLRRNYENVQ